MRHSITTTWAGILALVSFTGAAQPAEERCEPTAELEFVCGPENAEDLVRVPATPWVVASGMAEGAGFTLLDSRDGSFGTLGFDADHDPEAFPRCPQPPSAASLSSHGLNIRATENGRARLYVVGHGAREAIEVFDVAADGQRPALTWRGCVEMPEGLPANSVASLPDGSLLATVLILPGRTFADSVARRPTGVVYEWQPGSDGFERVEGTELPGNNGIETSEDGEEFYVVSSGYQTVVAFSHTNPARELRSTAPLPFTPDNLHRGPDGRLLTAGMKNDVPECGGAPGPQHDLERLATCPRGTIVVAIDPATMAHTVLLETEAVPSFSNATMALAVDDELWIGTFSGDRIARVAVR